MAWRNRCRHQDSRRRRTSASRPLPQPLASRHPAGRDRQAGRRLHRRGARLDRRPDQERRQCHRHPRLLPAALPSSRRPDRSHRSRARRHPGRRYSRYRSRSRATNGATPASSRQQRRRLPHRPLPRTAQGDLGLQGHLCELAPYPEGPVRRHHPSRPDRLRAEPRAAGELEQARARTDRHQSRTACRRSRCRREPGVLLGA